MIQMTSSDHFDSYVARWPPIRERRIRYPWQHIVTFLLAATAFMVAVATMSALIWTNAHPNAGSPLASYSMVASVVWVWEGPSPTCATPTVANATITLVGPQVFLTLSPVYLNDSCFI